VVLGMLLGFVIQQIFLPPDHGYWANGLVNTGNEQATALLSDVAAKSLDRAQLREATAALRLSSSELKQAHDLLKTDLDQSWVSPHLQRNRVRLPLFWCYHELFDSIVNFLETLDTFNAQFESLNTRWKEDYRHGLARLVEQVADLRVERPALQARPLPMGDLNELVEALPAAGAYTSVYLGHLTGYGILLSRLSDMHTAHLAEAPH
jgi:hypothetical protein